MTFRSGGATLKSVNGLPRGLKTRTPVIHSCLTMATTTIRELRNQFPKVKKMVETEGEVIVTDNEIGRAHV